MNALYSHRRWFDDKILVTKSMELLEVLHSDIQRVILQGTNRFARFLFSYKLDDSLRSFGVQRILALHQSKRKRRKFDRNPALHRTLNYLSLLPDNEQYHMALNIFGVIHYTAQQFHQNTVDTPLLTAADVEELSQRYACSSSYEKKKFLDELSTRLERTILAQRRNSSPVIKDSQDGMKVVGDRFHD